MIITKNLWDMILSYDKEMNQLAKATMEYETKFELITSGGPITITFPSLTRVDTKFSHIKSEIMKLDILEKIRNLTL